MTHTVRRPLEDLLDDEAHAWHESSPTEYDAAVTELIERNASDSESSPSANVLLAIAGATLRRPGQLLVESRAMCAQRLLSVISATQSAGESSRAHLLFLLAWLQLVGSLAKGPSTIRTTAELPAGANIPHGADIEYISDPALRAEARAMAESHLQEVERWRAARHAFRHLVHLATVLRMRSRHPENGPAWEELRVAAVLTVELTLDGLDRQTILDNLSGD
jgi:hypothetical protein